MAKTIKIDATMAAAIISNMRNLKPNFLSYEKPEIFEITNDVEDRFDIYTRRSGKYRKVKYIYSYNSKGGEEVKILMDGSWWRQGYLQKRLSEALRLRIKDKLAEQEYETAKIMQRRLK